MSIACGCDFDDDPGVRFVGEPREVTCRTKVQSCSACQKQILVGKVMYRWSRYDYEEMQTMAPGFLCQECGEMAENLIDKGFCFGVGDGSIREKWLDYAFDNGIISFHPMHPELRGAAS